MTTKQLTLPPGVSPTETRLIIQTTDREGNEIETIIFAGADRDGATLKTFSHALHNPESVICPEDKSYSHSNGDFDNPLVASVWQLMGVEM